MVAQQHPKVGNIVIVHERNGAGGLVSTAPLLVTRVDGSSVYGFAFDEAWAAPQRKSAVPHFGHENGGPIGWAWPA